ncbi:hypothetical protein MRB53_015897 [Persea americana]|uniref:Uncharacterized protein n=1 Tax=Persea americana TaxID=3435 RepID=A0ACC2M0N5_PERAE|nr:hypothetical protein MRB53_015897 [Persea americana]
MSPPALQQDTFSPMAQMTPSNTTAPAATSVPSDHNPPPTHSGSLKISEHVPPSTTTHIHPTVTRLRDGIRKPKMLLATKHPISVDVTLVDPLHDESTCVTEAAKHSHWRAAMNSEFNALIRNGTWAQPYFKDLKRFQGLYDPALQGNFPAKGLNQAVAVAAMCLQEEASVRPLITDVVIALVFFPTTDSVSSSSLQLLKIKQ